MDIQLSSNFVAYLFTYLVICLGVAIRLSEPSPESLREAYDRAYVRYRIGKIKATGDLYGRQKGN